MRAAAGIALGVAAGLTVGGWIFACLGWALAQFLFDLHSVRARTRLHEYIQASSVFAGACLGMRLSSHLGSGLIVPVSMLALVGWFVCTPVQ